MNYADRLQKIIDAAMPALLKADPEYMSDKPSEKKWSKKEILGHLIDSAEVNQMRFRMAAIQNNLVFAGYDQDKLVVDQHYQSSPLSSIIESWQVANDRIRETLGQLSPKILERECNEHNFHQICSNKITAESKTSLSYLIWDYLSHLEHHLSQILPEYTKQNPPFEN